MAETTGTKDDKGKDRYSLVLCGMSLALRSVIKLAEFGAKKYGENNWMSVENGAVRYREALLRHFMADFENPGSLDDGPEGSGLPHATAVAWNALAYLWFILQGKY